MDDCCFHTYRPSSVPAEGHWVGTTSEEERTSFEYSSACESVRFTGAKGAMGRSLPQR
jgi:hypothetical protein